MPDRLGQVNRLLDEVEQKGALFLGTLLDSDIFEVAVGKVKINYDDDGRAYLLQKSNGLPVWFDVTVCNRNQAFQEFGLSVDFYEYEQEYARLRETQLNATRENRPLDASDALEALVLAELVKDNTVAETLIFRFSKQFPDNAEVVLPLLGRGNSRVRSAIGRIIAMTGEEKAIKILLEYLKEEAAEGVRADIITAYIQANSTKGTIPEAVLEQWLGSEELVDALSCITAIAALGVKLPATLLQWVNEQHRPALAGWFEPE